MQKIALAIIPLLTCLSSISHATILSGSISSGAISFTKLTLPFKPPNGPANTVGNDDFNTDIVYGFDESQNVTITGSPLAVDMLASGLSGTLAIGTVVASHYVFFDPAATTTTRATVTFDAPVLSIITSTATLSASDYLAKTGVNYLSPQDRGLEPGDSATIFSTNTIAFNVTASSPGDYVRVLTAFSPAAVNPVPEPPSVGILGLAISAIFAMRRNPRKASSIAL